MVTHQIVAIRKPDRESSHEHITHVKYDGTVQTREYVISLIERKTDSFYVVGGGRKIDVKVMYPSLPRRPFIQTEPDSTQKDNLLSLPSC